MKHPSDEFDPILDEALSVYRNAEPLDGTRRTRAATSSSLARPEAKAVVALEYRCRMRLHPRGAGTHWLAYSSANQCS